LYAKLQKFRAHRIEWDNLERDIPLGYLDAIGADRQTMIDLVACDRAEFEKVVQLPFFPSCAVIRYMACVYGTLKFPAGTTEQAAIEICKESKMNTCINYPGIKSIFIEGGEIVIERFYPPEISFTKNQLIRRGDGRSIGTAYL
jgi:hypothetical protein